MDVYTPQAFNAAQPGGRDILITLGSIPDLVSRVMTAPLDPEYAVQKAGNLGPEDFRLDFLSAQEMDRINTFKVKKKQIEWSCGRFAMKTLAQRQLMPHTPLREITIDYQDQGAPYLKDFPEYCISLSHSGIYTAAALCQSPGKILGLDIEAQGPMPDAAFMNIAFTPKEIQGMNTDPQQVYRCWTLKEAYLKYIRKGFNESLHQVEIIGEEIFHSGKKIPVACRSWIIEPGYTLSLVH